jgi:hypothetical protein
MPENFASVLIQLADPLHQMRKVVIANPGATILALSSVQLPNSNPGITTEVLLKTITIPGGAMGPDGLLRISTMWQANNNANVKTARVRVGGIGGTLIMAYPFASLVQGRAQNFWSNRGSESSQLGWGASTSNAGQWTSSAGSMITTAVDTSVDWDLVITSQLATGTDTLNLEGYLVELLNPPTS